MLTMSAIVCTRNRAQWSARAVQSLLAQNIDADRLEVVVVDNASTDDTAEVLQAIVEGEPNATYVYEAETGLSRARNRGIAESTGDVVAFLDDDAEATAGWAATHLRCYEGDAEVAGTGGRIELGWPSGRPEWLPSTWDGMYAGLDRGPAVHTLEHPQIPFGANMAIRRRCLVGDRAFNVELGRQGDDLTSGEERELFERLRNAGGRLVYLPEASVTHHVLPDRLGRRWFLRRAYAQGRTHVLIDRYVRERRHALYWAARAGYQGTRAVANGSIAAARVARRSPPDVAMDAVATAAKAAGASRESLRVLVDRS